MPLRALAKWFRWSNTRQAWQERLGTAGVVAAGLLLWLYAGAAPPWAKVLAWASLALVLAVFLRRGWLKLFGPVLFYDLVRSARRSRTFLVRTGYLGLLFLALCWMYLTWVRQEPVGGPIHSGQVAEFSLRFFATFMIAQLVLVIVLTPAYTAGAVAEEKERRTLEFILATDLRNREIVLSKVVSRLAHLSLLLLAGLPVLSALQFIGGFSPRALLLGFAGTGATMVGLACLSILASVLCRRTRDALMFVYLVILAYGAVSYLAWFLRQTYAPVMSFPSTASWDSPLTLEDVLFGVEAGNPILRLQRLGGRGGPGLDALPSALGSYALFHGLLAAVCLIAAVALLRRASLAEPRAPRLAAQKKQTRPAVGARPMVWKEIWLERLVRRRWLVGAAVLVLILLSFFPVVIMVSNYFNQVRAQGSSYYNGRGYYWDPWERLGQEVNVWVRSVGMLVAVLGLAAVGVRAATSVRAEHDRDTMTGLLTSPLTSEEILFAKWLGSVLSVRWLAVWLAAIWCVGVGLGGLCPAAVPLLAVAYVVYAGAIASLGLWFSVVCRTTLRAILATLLAALGLCAGHWLPWMCLIPCVSQPAEGLKFVARLQGSVTPPVVLSVFLPWRTHEITEHVAPPSEHPIWLMFLGASGVACWGLFAWAVWFKTNERFKKVGGRIDTARPANYVPTAADRPAPAARVAAEHAHNLKGFRPDRRILEETDFGG
jgi:ABC-type transport system involved in multi-copper enzyme maturation permease subunit